MNLHNFLWHNRLRRKLPFSFVHFLTFCCNCHCPHCFVDEKNNPSALNMQELEKFITGISPGTYNVNLTGGEPFCLNNFIDIVLLYWDRSPVSSIYLCTNGSFPDKVSELLRRLPRRNNKTLTISVSMDHLPEQHDQMRGQTGLFNKTLSVFQILGELKHPQVRGNAALTIQEGNHKDILQILDFFQTLNLPALTITLQRNTGKLADPGIKINNHILQAYQKACPIVCKNRPSDNSFFSKIITAKNQLMQEQISLGKNMPYIPCAAGQDFAVMHPDGSVFPCEILTQPIGNIKDFNFSLSQLLKEKGGELNKQIRKNRCSCTYECARGVNLLLSPVWLTQILRKI